MRTIAIIVVILSAPTMLGTYAWGLSLIFDIVGPLWFLAICGAHVISWIGVGCLIDEQKQQGYLKALAQLNGPERRSRVDPESLD